MAQAVNGSSVYAQRMNAAARKFVAVECDLDLVDMVDALAKRSNAKTPTFVRRLLADTVNSANLTQVDAEGNTVAWTYDVARLDPKSAAQQLKDELAAAKAEIEALKALIPTPPTQIADARTGELKVKAA